MSMQGQGTIAKPSHVRMFLRADSAEKLVSLQLQLNTLIQGQASFTDITYVNDLWYAWFLIDFDEYGEAVIALNGST